MCVYVCMYICLCISQSFVHTSLKAAWGTCILAPCSPYLSLHFFNSGTRVSTTFALPRPSGTSFYGGASSAAPGKSARERRWGEKQYLVSRVPPLRRLPNLRSRNSYRPPSSSSCFSPTAILHASSTSCQCFSLNSRPPLPLRVLLPAPKPPVLQVSLARGLAGVLLETPLKTTSIAN